MIGDLDRVDELLKQIDGKLERLSKMVAVTSAFLPQQVSQVQSFVSLVSFINPVYPLPRIGTWTGAADFALLLATTILDRAPHIVVEAGSGLSTVIIGYCLQRMNKGRLISLEHEERFWLSNRDLLKKHRLDTVVEVKLAPITAVSKRGAALLARNGCHHPQKSPTPSLKSAEV